MSERLSGGYAFGFEEAAGFGGRGDEVFGRVTLDGYL